MFFNKMIESIKESIIETILSTVMKLTDSLNITIGDIAADVGKTTATWNIDVYNMIKDLSMNVILPIAGCVIAIIACYELYYMVCEKNNMREFDVSTYGVWGIKLFITILIVINSQDIVNGLFEITTSMVIQSSNIIKSNTSLNVLDITNFKENLETLGTFNLFMISFEIWLISFTITIIDYAIRIILLGRMIQIYLLSSIAPLPFANVQNKDWGQIGKNYFLNLAALGIQGFFIIVCVAIYAVLIKSIVYTSDIHEVLRNIVIYTVVLCLSLFKTHGLAKSVLNAH